MTNIYGAKLREFFKCIPDVKSSEKSFQNTLNLALFMTPFGMHIYSSNGLTEYLLQKLF